jgi:shikimate dehydrogenase
MSRTISGRTIVAGVAGAPVAHSLSPLIHNAWLAAAGIDGVYVAFTPPTDGFAAFARGLAGGAIRGLNVTVPFKETALEIATNASDRALRAGAANLLIFERDGTIFADNTDGEGLLAALAEQAPGLAVSAGPAVILGAGGAARGAAAALIAAGCGEVRLVNRTHGRAVTLAATLGPAARALKPDADAFSGAALVINATTQGLGGGDGPQSDFKATREDAVVLDMVYRPLRTEFLRQAAHAGRRTADGLAMLIGQAVPSFATLFGAEPPDIDARAICLKALEETG